VPALAIFAPSFKVMVPAVGERFLPESIVKVPPTLKEAVGCVLGVPEICNPLKVKVPELAMLQPVPVMVMVPAVGERFLPESIVKVPPTLKEAVG